MYFHPGSWLSLSLSLSLTELIYIYIYRDVFFTPKLSGLPFLYFLLSICLILRAPPPLSVHKANPEWHLSDNEFVNVFKMDRDAFNALTSWKKTEARKTVGLF